MRASWHIALNGVWGRPGRSALLAAAVLLASSLVVAVACGVGSAQRAIEAGLHRIIGATDARIIDEHGGRFDEAILDQVRRWPDVGAAGARLFSSVTLVHRPSGQGDAGHGAATEASPDRPGAADRHGARANIRVRGIDLDTLDRFGQVALSEGRMPRTDREILLDPLAAKALNAGVGDTLTLQRFGPPMEFTVVGVYDRPALGILQRPEAVLSRQALAEASRREGEVSVVSLILEDVEDIGAWCAANQHRLPEGLLLEPAEMFTTGYDRQVRAARLGFIFAAAVAFLSCAFIVATGMTTAVVEQQRLMAMVRCIGASRSQLFMAQVIAGLLICGVGGVLGVPLGIGLAWILVARLRDIMSEGLAVSPAGIVLALAGALSAGAAGALWPAWQASRISPLQALAARAQPPSRRGFALAVGVGLACVTAQALLLGLLRDPQQRFWTYVTAGMPLVHLGWFLLSVPLMVLVVAVAGGGVERLFALPRGLLRSAMQATPFRAGFTAGALMVGMSILVSTWSHGRSLLDDWFGRLRFADGFVFRFSGISPDEQQALAQLPFVRASCPIGYQPLRISSEAALGVQGIAPPNVVCIGFDPQQFFAMTRLDWKQGSPEEAIPALRAGEGVLVAEQFLIARGIGVGDAIRLGSGRSEREFRVAGVVSAAGLDIATQWFGIRSAYLEHAISCVFMDFDTLRREFGTDEAMLMQLALSPDVSDEAAAEAIEATVPGVVFCSGRAIRLAIEEIGGVLLAVSTGVAVAALLLGSFGVGNVIAAGVHSRRHEFGVLRAVGGSAWLPARLVCAEAVLIGLGGALTGTLLGLQLAWISAALNEALVGIPLRVVVPAAPIAAGWATVVGVAVAAALPAAWMVARTSPRELLATGRAG